ncbi:IS1182 family transposase [Kitasatospora aureofaciens]|uniref:IS1182 family transposase n=1 Tax=Kitasatospora aureofaciens TaxID=1894 RepID=UPI0027DFD2D8|nr:IS1182 family transposase [Kitasatospora aureofaciens]
MRQACPRGTAVTRVRDALGELFRDQDFLSDDLREMFSELGRPALSPAKLTMVLVLQFLENLTDRETVQAVALRLDWKYALGMDPGEPAFDASVLSEFRDRISQGDRVDRLLAVMVERLRQAGLVRRGGRQRTDSTHVLGAVRQLSRFELVAETLRATLEQIAAIVPDWVSGLLEPGWDRRYGRRVEAFRLVPKGASVKPLAEQVGADGRKLLAAIDDETAWPWLGELPAVQVLRRVWDQQYTCLPEGYPRWRESAELEEAATEVRSPYDTETRHSGKRGMEWDGYKTHVTETCDPDLPHLVTHVADTPATDPDVTMTTAIEHDLVARELAPGEHLVDMGYTSDEARLEAQRAGIDLVGPVRPSGGRNAKNSGMFTIADFHIDWESNTATCPQGQTSRPGRPGTASGRPHVRFPFTVADCRTCPLRPRCTRSTDPDHARQLIVPPRERHELRHDAAVEQQSDTWRARYRARAGIEGTISQLVRSFGARRTRYTGLAKTHTQHVLTGMACNLARLGDWYDPHPKAPRPGTRVRTLCEARGLTT